MTEKQPNPAALVALYEAGRWLMHLAHGGSKVGLPNVTDAEWRAAQDEMRAALALADSPPSEEPSWKTSHICNVDGHTCPACGVPVKHDEGVCRGCEVGLLNDEIATLRRQLDDARGIIEQEEWESDPVSSIGYCPVCVQHRDIGHAKDCSLAAVLASTGEAKGGES